MKCFKSPVWGSYLIINLIFAGMIACIMLYSGIFSDTRANHPIPCIHERVTGRQCPSCGMSRGFSAIVRGKWEEAEQFNPHSRRVFLFFAIQFLLRLLISLVIMQFPLAEKYCWKADAAFSSVLFFYCFWGLIKGMVLM
jgi:hypothetical protein